MFRTKWGLPENKKYEYGIDRGILQVDGGATVPWDGLVSMVENPPGKEIQTTIYDGVKVVNYQEPSDFSGTLQAYYSPEEFDVCDGSLEHIPGLFSTNNPAKTFNLSYRTMIGEHDYRLHFVYNASATPTDRNYTTISDTLEPETLSWDITTQPNMESGANRRSHFYLDTTKTSFVAVRLVENILYGVSSTLPRFPTYEVLSNTVEMAEGVELIDHGDGRWTIDGPDHIVKVLSATLNTFEVDWEGVTVLGNGTFEIRN